MKLIIFTVLSLAAMAACDETSVDDLLQHGNDQFTAKMFSELVKENPGKSAVMSGFSVLTPLAQLALASENASHDELLRAIGMPSDNATKEVFTLVNQRVRSVKGVDLKMASRIYIPIGNELNENFQSVSRDVFGSDVKNVDFTQNKATAAEINTWVEDQTNKRIKDLVDPDSLSSDTKAVLVNAIYFKGKWQEPFQKELTEDLDFHVSKDKTIKVPTMRRRGEYQYAESEELKAKLLRLPYEGGEASMLIILPNEIDGLPALEEKLRDPEALAKATKKMFTYEVDVSLPKFKIETTTDLKKVLNNIGVKRIFNAQEAQLNKLLKGTENGLYVSKATQKAFIEVNEEGAEAAAANVHHPLIGPAVPIPRMVFDANRPFYYDIKATGFTIFNGVVHF